MKHKFLHLYSWWDAGKARLKVLIRKLGREVSTLNIHLQDTQHRINKGEQLSSLLEEIKFDLESKLCTKAKGARLRAKIQYESISTTLFWCFFTWSQKPGALLASHKLPLVLTTLSDRTSLLFGIRENTPLGSSKYFGILRLVVQRDW